MFRYFILSTKISVYNTKVKLHFFNVAQTHRRLNACLGYVLESDGKWLLSIWPLPDFSVTESGSEIRTRSVSNLHFLLPQERLKRPSAAPKYVVKILVESYMI